MKNNFPEFAKTGIQRARQMGADHAELFVVKSRSLEVEIKDGSLEQIKQSDSQGVGLRVMKGKRQGFSFSSDFRSSALDRMVTQAIANSSYNDEEPALYFPGPGKKYPQLDLYDADTGNHSLDEKIELARETARCAERYAAQVQRIERSGYEEGDVEMWLANSNGVLLHQKGNYCGLFCLALGEKDAEQQSGYGMDSCIALRDLSPERAGNMAGRRAVQLLGAAPVSSGVMDLVLEPLIAMQMLGIISACFSGEAVLKNKSFLAGRLGECVASPELTLIDDGTLPNRLGSASFDGEGTASQRTVLLENGVLQNYLYDCLSAAKAGKSSTGNGMRGSYKGTPHISTSNYYLQAGGQTPARLVGDVERGIYVTEILGAHTANPVSGDFSFGASGILIEHGRLSRPVRGIAIAGNFQQLLQKVSGVGNDLTFYGSQGAPTVRISDISVSGT